MTGSGAAGMIQRRPVLIMGNDFYEVEKDAVRAKKASKTPLVSEIQTSTVQQMIQKNINGSAGTVALKYDLMQPDFLAAAKDTA